MVYLVLQHRLMQRCACFCLSTLVGSVLLAGLDRVHAPVVAQGAPVAAAPARGATQIVLMVNPTVGNDAVADGSDRAPFKTITQALQVAPAGAIILLTPGTYSQETGERFPLRLKPDVTVQGNTETRGQDIVIQGGGYFLSPTFARQTVALLGADRAILAGVTVKNPDPQGYGVWIESTSPAIVDSTFTESGHDGISVTGNGSPLVRNNYFYQNGANGITIYGTSQAEVRENIFEQTGFAINVNQKATPLLVGNRITQNKDGIVVQASAQPILRNNSVDGNTRDGLVAIAQSRPDLGTATAPGGNLFHNNGQFDVNVKASSQPIPAFGNDLETTMGPLDLTGTILEPTVAAGVPMPWSGLVSPSQPSVGSRPVALALASRSPVSADKSTATDGRKASLRPLKPALSSVTDGSTILFGQRLVSDPSSGVGLQATAQPSLPPAAGLSAASFPIPTTQLPRSPSRLVLPLITAPIAPASDPAFPVASAASAIKTLPRPLPMARMTTAPQLPPQGAVEPNNALPLVPVRSSPLPFVPITNRVSLVRSARRLAPVPTIQSSVALGSGMVPRTGAIEIPVPAPETRSPLSPVRSVAAVPAIASTSTPLTSAGLLPVPNPDAPIGNVGSASIVYRSQQSASAGDVTPRAALGLRYRVVVAPGDESQQAQIRAAFPNAFRTFIKGRSLMQVGAFGDRTKAEQLMQTLSSQGVQAMVEALE